MPTLTLIEYGQGKAYYVATRSDEKFYRAFIGNICREAGVEGIMETPDGVEATVRRNEKGKFLFVLNHTPESKEIALPDSVTDLTTGSSFIKNEKISLASRDVMILEIR